MPAGDLDRRATFLRRVAQEPYAGNERGDYATLFTMSAGFRPAGSRERLAYGIAEDVIQGDLTVRECNQVAQLNASDRVSVRDLGECSIVSIYPKDRSGYRRIVVRREMGV